MEKSHAVAVWDFFFSGLVFRHIVVFYSLNELYAHMVIGYCHGDYTGWLSF